MHFGDYNIDVVTIRWEKLSYNTKMISDGTLSSVVGQSLWGAKLIDFKGFYIAVTVYCFLHRSGLKLSHDKLISLWTSNIPIALQCWRSHQSTILWRQDRDSPFSNSILKYLLHKLLTKISDFRVSEFIELIIKILTIFIINKAKLE